MKYLSKYYRPAEKEFLKLGKEFKNLVKMEEAAKKTLHPDVYKFMEVLTEMMERVEVYVADRIAAEEKKAADEAAKRANYEADCPRCNEPVSVIVTGEIKVPKTGYTHYTVQCKVCKKHFTPSLPSGDEDLLKWQNNFITQMKVVEPDGRTRAERLEVSEGKLMRLEEDYEAFKEAVRKEKEAFRQQAEVEALLDKEVEKLRDELLLIRLRQQKWNPGEAQA